MLAGGVDPVDGTAGHQTEGVGAQLVRRMGVGVEHLIKQPAAAGGAAGAHRNDVVALQRRLVGGKHHGRRIGVAGGVKLIHIIPDGGVQTGVHAGLQPLIQAHVQNCQRLDHVSGKLPQQRHRVVGAGVIHRHQLILVKVGLQLLHQQGAEFRRPCAVIVEIHHRRHEIFFLVHHTSNTSSRS